MIEQKKTVFVLGSKGIPANYGGFETFVDKLISNQIDRHIQYYVSCQISKNDYTDELYEYNGAKCFRVRVPDISAARAVYYDWLSLRWTLHYIKENKIRDAVVFICGYRIGPFIALNRSKIKKLGVTLIINPDGHEWLRAKWNSAIKRYWKYSEKLCVKYADLLICDSVNIENYVRCKFKKYNPRTTFIAYGAETSRSLLADDDPKIKKWYKDWDLAPNEYYVNIARLVPENNYETIIREFMASSTQKKLVIVASLDKNRFFGRLKEKLHFEDDKRIKFVNGIYDQELLKKIRENAYGYIHGHSVGGTNPSLLEALGTLDLCLLYDVGFNREVGEDGALYWTLNNGSLKNLIEEADHMPTDAIKQLGSRAHKRMEEYYTWRLICEKYEREFKGV